MAILPTEGSLQLREAVARHVAHYGIRADVDNVLITQGSQQALDLICMALIDPGDPVLMEAPGYLGAIGAIQNYEADIRDIPVGDDGIDPARLARGPTGPSFSTPYRPTTTRRVAPSLPVTAPLFTRRLAPSAF